MADHVILHYEDEPHRVDLPGKMEVALYKHPDVTDCRLDESEDLQDFKITFSLGADTHSIRYVIAESIASAEVGAGIDAEDAVLHLVDRSINNDFEAGIGIVNALLERGVPRRRIWMVTAYEPEARHDLRLKQIEIYAKPSPTTLMVERMLDMTLASGG